MNSAIVDLLACHTCRGELTLDGEVAEDRNVREGRLTCNACNSRYYISNGVALMLPAIPEDERWKQWEHKQELGLEEYENPNPESKAQSDQIAAEFGAFCELKGTILDVGCGIEREPSYAIRPPESRYVGVDPFVGEGERAFEFVQGLGEWLPFQAASFDCVVCATVLDHLTNPARVMSEIRRVLKPDGRLGLWVGVFDPQHLRKSYEGPYGPRDLVDRGRRRKLLERLREREMRDLPRLIWRHLILRPVRVVVGRVWMRLDEAGMAASVFAENSKYHFHLFNEEEVSELVTQSGFKIVKRRRIADNSLFLLAVPNQEG